jgi:transposase
VTDADRIAQLERIVEELQRKLAEATRTVEQLTEENGRLRKVEEAWRRGLRERSKRRSSKAAGGAFIGPKRKRGRPGGVVGSNRPVPPEVDHVKCHDMPATCTCGGAVEATGETKSTIVEDIPPVKVERTRHDAPVGQCTKCRKKVHARLPGMTADGTTAAHTQLGPGAISLVESLRMDLRASMRGIEKFVDEWFKLSLSSGGVSQLLEREAVRSRPAVDEISAHIEKAKLAGADETGMSEDGKLAWVWLVQTPEASLFRVERSRAACVVDEMLGGFTGVLTSDFYAAYTRPNLPWKQAFCGGHLVRDAKKFAELGPSTATITFSERLSSLYHYGQLAVSTGSAPTPTSPASRRASRSASSASPRSSTTRRSRPRTTGASAKSASSRATAR